MKHFLFEYLYCVIYVCSLSIVVITLIKEKVTIKRTIVLIGVYGLVNYLITGANSLELFNYFILNSLIVICDYIFICCLFKNKSTYYLFYATLFMSIYTFSINFIINQVNIFFKTNLDIFFTFSLQRFLIIIFINIFVILMILTLNKIKILPDKKILKRESLLFILSNILVGYAMMLIFNINLTESIELVLFLVLILLVLWLIILKVLSKYIVTTIKNEQLLVEKISDKYINKYIDFYQQESNKLRKIKHDLKNYKSVLENVDRKKQYNEFIDEIFLEVNNDYIETKNIFIDACLYAKKQEFKEVTFKYDILINGLEINDKDITSLLFNLLDNACNEAMLTDKNVSLVMKYYNGVLVIKVTNKCLKKPSFVSDKGFGHGYGLKIINSIVNKYHGFIDYNYESNMKLLTYSIKINV